MHLLQPRSSFSIQLTAAFFFSVVSLMHAQSTPDPCEAVYLQMGTMHCGTTELAGTNGFTPTACTGEFYDVKWFKFTVSGAGEKLSLDVSNVFGTREWGIHIYSFSRSFASNPETAYTLEIFCLIFSSSNFSISHSSSSPNPIHSRFSSYSSSSGSARISSICS